MLSLVLILLVAVAIFVLGEVAGGRKPVSIFGTIGGIASLIWILWTIITHH